jgi:hypothetical protein
MCTRARLCSSSGVQCVREPGCAAVAVCNVYESPAIVSSSVVQCVREPGCAAVALCNVYTRARLCQQRHPPVNELPRIPQAAEQGARDQRARRQRLVGEGAVQSRLGVHSGAVDFRGLLPRPATATSAGHQMLLRTICAVQACGAGSASACIVGVCACVRMWVCVCVCVVAFQPPCTFDAVWLGATLGGVARPPALAAKDATKLLLLLQQQQQQQ